MLGADGAAEGACVVNARLGARIGVIPRFEHDAAIGANGFIAAVVGQFDIGDGDRWKRVPRGGRRLGLCACCGGSAREDQQNQEQQPIHR